MAGLSPSESPAGPKAATDVTPSGAAAATEPVAVLPRAALPVAGQAGAAGVLAGAAGVAADEGGLPCPGLAAVALLAGAAPLAAVALLDAVALVDAVALFDAAATSVEPWCPSMMMRS